MRSAPVSLIRRFVLNRILLPLAFAALLGSAGTADATGVGADGQKPLPQIPLGSSTEYPVVDAGANAPDFSYETLAGAPARLRDLRAQGHVLLVFGATEPDLRQLELEAGRLKRLGVVPVAVLDWRVGACRSVVKKLSLTFPVVPDPQRTIGAQYNVLDPRTRQHAYAWFVVDRRGRVRGLDRFELPREPWETVAATSLGLPTGDTPRPASNGP